MEPDYLRNYKPRLFAAPSLVAFVLYVQFIGLVTAVFDPLNPGNEEIFDPAEADPFGQITCPDEGSLAWLHLPRIESSSDRVSVDPNTLTLQQLCAKPQYGGWGPGLHLGGFCTQNPRSPVPYAIVSFDTTPAARTSTDLTSPRLLLYCQTRCYCTNPFALADERKENFEALKDL